MTNHFNMWKFTAIFVNCTVINDFQVHLRGKFSNIFWPLENLNFKKPLSSPRIYLSHKIFMIDLFNTQYFANQILIANTKMRWSPSIYNTRTFANFFHLLQSRLKFCKVHRCQFHLTTFHPTYKHYLHLQKHKSSETSWFKIRIFSFLLYRATIKERKYFWLQRIHMGILFLMPSSSFSFYLVLLIHHFTAS